jgi:glucose-fructose oxidoreductase
VIDANSGFNIGDPEQWRLKRALSGGGSMMDIGIYSVQAARYLTGEEPVDVNALEYTPQGDPRFREVEDTINFQLRFPSGVLANCVSAYSSNHNRYRLVGTNGWLELEPATGYSGQAMRVGLRGDVEPRVLPEPAKNQFVGELDHLSECVLNGTDPIVGGEEGLRVMRVLSAIYEAARTGRTVQVGS